MARDTEEKRICSACKKECEESESVKEGCINCLTEEDLFYLLISATLKKLFKEGGEES